MLNLAARRFWKRDEGSFAPAFALSLAALLSAVGVSVDYTRSVTLRARLQAATDSAALNLSKEAAQLTDAQLQARAEELVATGLSGASYIALKLSLTKGAGVLNLQTTATQKTTVSGLFAVHTVDVAAASIAQWGIGKVEVALVLDNTGSMAGTKLTNLKTAAKSLIDQLGKAQNDQQLVKVGIVPFSMTVNVGGAYQNASWMDTKALSPIHGEIFTSAANRFDLFNKMGVAWGGCVESRPMPYDVQETPPSQATPATLFVPFFAPDEPDSGGAYYNNYLSDASGTSTWRDRQGDPRKYTKAPKRGTNSVGYTYGPNAGCALAPITRLTNNLDSAKTAIDQMVAVGDTNIAMGLAWGWHVLSPNAPFADGAAYGTKDLTKFAILMTDGDNTNTDTSNADDSIYSGIGYIWQNRLGISSGTAGQRQTAMDNRLKTLCSNMKAQGVQLFTVRVEVTTGSSSLLQSCASDPSMFYNVANSADLTSVFSQISAKIAKLHLAM
ncbi:VWA domain-containing protein [Alsobacter soli]|nr:VWA domain-containing protein [Alsobacter soli]